MKNLLTTNKIIIFIVLITSIVVLGSVLFFRNKEFGNKTTQTMQELKVTGVNPDTSQILKPGKMQRFTVDLSKPIQINTLEVEISSSDITKEEPSKKVEITLNRSNNQNMLNIKTNEPILPLHTYTLKVNEKSSNKLLLEKNYISDNPEPIKEQINNLGLVKYLPQKTEAYTLSYVPQRNVYVFSFNYNPSSKDSIEVQFDKAKSTAIRFIQSKNINLDSIVIEWNFK